MGIGAPRVYDVVDTVSIGVDFDVRGVNIPSEAQQRPITSSSAHLFLTYTLLDMVSPRHQTSAKVNRLECQPNNYPCESPSLKSNPTLSC